MIFVDTSAWFELWSVSDPNHSAAIDFHRRRRTWLVTTDFIIDETLTLPKARGLAEKARRICHPVFGGNYADVEHITDGDLLAAADMFCRYSDKDWSFTDCTSFVVIRRLGIRRAFAFDQHFRQFGEVENCP